MHPARNWAKRNLASTSMHKSLDVIFRAKLYVLNLGLNIKVSFHVLAFLIYSLSLKDLRSTLDKVLKLCSSPNSVNISCISLDQFSVVIATPCKKDCSCHSAIAYMYVDVFQNLFFKNWTVRVHSQRRRPRYATQVDATPTPRIYIERQFIKNPV